MPDPFAPPGETTDYRCERTLVVAPHADDDILGCGGLLARLVDGGARVRVLFLTDSAGGSEVPGAEPAYAEQRREEAARALAALGITDTDHLDLPDGALNQEVEACADGIRNAIIDHRPDLLLSVGPTEITNDHLAAFAALHRVFEPLRGGTELDDIAAGMRILLYEVNHPGYPDRLVDVTDVVDRLTRAIRCHASQLERHDYLSAALGARRFRTLSLPPSVRAAEGYRELRPSDLTNRSLAGAIRWLGGHPSITAVDRPPLVSVVVRTRNRQQLLVEALDSLASQSWRRTEVVLVNDGGSLPAVREDYPLPLVRVDLEPNRGRAEAANAGIAAAHGDWIGFLDDDDLAEPEHVQTLVRIASGAGVRVAYTDAAVGVYELSPDGGWREVERRLPYSRDFDPDLLLVDNYIPFNTVLIDRDLLTVVGPLDPSLPFFEDWDLLIRLSELTAFHHVATVTCEYRHFRSSGHHVFGELPSARADFLDVKARVIAKHRSRVEADVVARAVDRLRADAVAAAEQAAARWRDLESVRHELAERVDSWHRLNGAREDLSRLLADAEADRDAHHGHAEELSAELERMFGEERALREAVTEQQAHLERTYAEIERLNGIIASMEGTRTWRWHRRVQRLLGRRDQP